MVTIGLPFYNAKKTLLDAVRSIFAQTYRDWELVLVDDGSTDDGVDVVKQITDCRITIHSDGRRTGLAARLNEIARMAKGEYLARMDADDLMHPSRLEAQISCMKANAGVDLVGTGTYIISDSCAPLGQLMPPKPPEGPFSIFVRNPLLHATVLGRTQWFCDNQYNEHFMRAQDYELWCRTAPEVRIVNISEALYYYRAVANFTFSRYLQNLKYGARALIALGPERIGMCATSYILGRTLCRAMVYSGAAALGCADRLVLMRYAKLTEHEMRDATEALTAIQAVQWPIVDS